MKETADFRRPSVAERKLTALITDDLSSIHDGLNLELSLFISPTFGGSTNPECTKLTNSLKKMLVDIDPKQLEHITSLINKGIGNVDIGAIGIHQRAMIRKRRVPGQVRIAILHHHLLPDPRVEIAPFESVIDAGQMLETLLANDYDLVITGHKHHRRMVTYESDGKRIDIYSAPSLFGADASSPEFTIVDIYGPDASNYAIVYSYSTESGERSKSYKLFRDRMLLPEVRTACMQIKKDKQRDYIFPLLMNILNTNEWCDSFLARFPSITTEFKQLILDVEEHCRNQFSRLGNEKKIVFVGADLFKKWASLIQMASTVGIKELRFVSNGDVEVWCKADDPREELYTYLRPLKNYHGKMILILLINKKEISRDKLRRPLQKIVEHGFVALIVPEEEASSKKDFVLFGKMAVTTLSTLKSSVKGRSMEECFCEKTIIAYNNAWDQLLARGVPEINNEEGINSYLETLDE